MTKDEALKLALEALELTARDYREQRQAITAIREALAQPEQINTIRALTEQCATLVWERDDLKKQVQTYEKHGVTCQTYRHKVKASCSECNMNEIYTAQPEQDYRAMYLKVRDELAELQQNPPHRKPLTDVEIWNTYKNLWMFHPAEEPRLAGDVLKFARAIEAAHGIKE